MVSQHCLPLEGSSPAPPSSSLEVFEDDWIFSRPPDSGCPSESLLEEEAVLDRANPDLLPPSHRHRGKSTCGRLLNAQECINCVTFFPSDRHPPDKPRPPAPPQLPSAAHEHLGLEWDPSVDIGRSVSPYDADSSYFSASTGREKQSWTLPPPFFRFFRNSSHRRHSAERLPSRLTASHPVESRHDSKGGGTRNELSSCSCSRLKDDLCVCSVCVVAPVQVSPRETL